MERKPEREKRFVAPSLGRGAWILLLSVLPPIAWGQDTFYGVRGHLYRLDPTTGRRIDWVPVEQSVPFGLTYWADRLYTLDPIFTAGPGALRVIHPASGENHAIGLTGVNATSWASLDFDPTTGILWSILDDKLYRIDHTTGQATFVAYVWGHQGAIRGFAIDAAGNAWGMDPLGDQTLHRVNLATGEATPVASVNISRFGSFYDLAFDGSGLLWGSFLDFVQPYDQSALYRIDVSTAVAVLMELRTDIYEGLAFGPGCPTTSYCTAKVNSQGCAPSIRGVGIPSATGSRGFRIEATEVLNNKLGLLFFGTNGPAAAPMQGGIRCVNVPIRRTGVLLSGGNAPPAQDCSGVWSLDFNTYLAEREQANGAPLFSPGTTLWCQWWGRDPGFAPPNHGSLSDALTFTLCL